MSQNAVWRLLSGQVQILENNSEDIIGVYPIAINVIDFGSVDWEKCYVLNYMYDWHRVGGVGWMEISDKIGIWWFIRLWFEKIADKRRLRKEQMGPSNI